MKEEILNVIKKYEKNREMIKSNFKYPENFDYDICSVVATVNNKEVDVNTVKEIHDLINSNFGVTSYARSMYRLLLSNVISMHDNYKEIFAEFKCNNSEIDESFIFKNTMLNGAYTLVNIDIENEQIIAKALQLYKLLNKEYFYFNRFTFASQLMLAASIDLPVEEIVKKINTNYKLLKQNKIKYSSAILISFILLLSENSHQDINKLVRILAKLKEDKIKFSKNGVSSLAIYCLVEEFDHVIIENIKQTYSYLKDNVKYSLAIPSTFRAMCSVIFTISTYKLNNDVKIMSDSYLLTYLSLLIQQCHESDTNLAAIISMI